MASNAGIAGKSHINDEGLRMPCGAESEDSCPFLRHFETEEAYVAWAQEQHRLTEAIKVGRVKKDPPPIGFALDAPWTKAQKIEAMDAIERLIIAEESSDHPDEERMARLRSYVNAVERMRDEDASDDAKAVKFLANQMRLEEHQYREYHNQWEQGFKYAAPFVRDLVDDMHADNPGRAERMPVASRLLGQFTVDGSTGVSRGEMNAITYMYALEDERAAREAGTLGTPNGLHYHVSKGSRRVYPCAQPDCTRKGQLGSYEDAMVTADSEPPLTGKKKTAHKEWLDAWNNGGRDQAQGESTSTVFSRTYGRFDSSDPNRKLLGQLHDRAVQPVDDYTYRDALRDVESQQHASRVSAISAIQHRQAATYQYARTVAWTKKLSVESPDEDTRQVMGSLHQTLVDNPPSHDPTAPGFTPATLRLVDREIHARGGNRPDGVPGINYAFKNDIPSRDAYVGAVNAHYTKHAHALGGTDGRYHGFVMIDTEVSDLDPSKGEVIEVGLAYMDKDGNPLGRVSWLAKPERNDGYVGMESLHRISKSMMTDDVPSQAQSAAALADMLHGWVPVAHNAHFDKAHVDNLLDRHALPRTSAWVDSLFMFKRKLFDGYAPDEKPRSVKTNLKEMSKAFELKFSDAHHAASSDVTAAGFCFQKMLPDFSFGIPFTDAVPKVPANPFTPSTVSRGGNQVELDDALWQDWVDNPT